MIHLKFIDSISFWCNNSNNTESNICSFVIWILEYLTSLPILICTVSMIQDFVVILNGCQEGNAV